MSTTNYGSSGNALVDAGRKPKVKAIKPKPDDTVPGQLQLQFGNIASAIGEGRIIAESKVVRGKLALPKTA